MRVQPPPAQDADDEEDEIPAGSTPPPLDPRRGVEGTSATYDRG